MTHGAKSTLQSEKFALVQALRGVAAVWVMLHHAFWGKHVEHLYKSLPSIVSNTVFLYGFFGVQIFFVLSGFIIAYSIRNKEVTPRFFRDFVIKRSIRLDPAYWAAIAFAIAMSAISAEVGNRSFQPPSVVDLLSHLTYTQAFFGHLYSISGVFWTLTYEVQFYLALVLLVMFFQLLAKKLGSISSGLLVFGAMYVVAWIWGVFIHADNSVGFFYVNWYGFFIGALAYWSASRKYLLFPFWVLIVGLVLSERDVSQVCALTAVVLHVALRTGHIVRSMSFAPIQFVGTISYSLYLTHTQVQGASMNLLYRYIPRTAIGEAFALALSAVCCVAVASLFWWIIERPSHNLAKRFGRSS
ncbi:MAG: acyltransferase [Cytophagaceae bacterium]|nr:MAG: acyltransferase [Cytophagaceae bacterium]